MNFFNYLKKYLIKIYTNTHQIASFFKIFSEDLLNPVMYAHLSLFEKKLQYKKVHSSQFLKGPLQFIKITLHRLHQLFKKKSISMVFVRFLKKQSISRVQVRSLSKKTVNFTRSKSKSHAS